MAWGREQQWRSLPTATASALTLRSLWGQRLQWWPDEILWQKHFLLCINNHWKYENKQYTIEKPYKIATRNAKKNFEFSKICWFNFRAFFKKLVFWENGRGRHQMGATLIHYTSIFNESQWGSPHESFIQKYWLVSNLPIFQNYWFFEKGPKNQQILKNSNFFLHFWWQFYKAFQWCIVCFHTFSGCWYTEGNVLP